MDTTILVNKKTKEKLEELKIHPRESYNTVIERLIEIRTDEGALSAETIRNIESALDDIKRGKVFSTKDVKKRLGIR